MSRCGGHHRRDYDPSAAIRGGTRLPVQFAADGIIDDGHMNEAGLDADMAACVAIAAGLGAAANTFTVTRLFGRQVTRQ
jgi:hypothetical protein